MEKVLIIGGSGLLGGHLIHQIKNKYEVAATFKGHPFEMEGCRSIFMDITNRDKTEDIILKEKSNLVILAAAQRNVDYCEKNPEKVEKINAEGAKNVAFASKKAQTKLIYLSTDLVFDGEKGSYVEEDETDPINHYGRTKLEGEREVENNCDDFAIARVSVLYDWNLFDYTTNFIAWVYDRLKEGKKLELFSDQFRNVTYVKNACDALIKIHEKDEEGVFHVAGKNCVNRFYIGKKVAETFGFDAELITPCSSDDGNWVAKRPKKCCLDTSKMQNKLGINPISIEEGLLAMKSERDNTAK